MAKNILIVVFGAVAVFAVVVANYSVKEHRFDECFVDGLGRSVCLKYNEPQVEAYSSRVAETAPTELKGSISQDTIDYRQPAYNPQANVQMYLPE